MNVEERKRLHILKKLADREIKPRTAGEMLGVSVRQIRRLLRRFRSEGDRAAIHKLRGRGSNRRIDPEFRRHVLDCYRSKYAGFGPTFAVEKFLEEQSVKISEETLRRWLKESKISYPSRRPRPHRQWRKRRSHRGEMVQLDGSHHAWLEDRGARLVLIAYIDDATSEVFARFYESEENFSALDSFMRYVHKNGVPCSIYSDRHSVYKAKDRQLNILEQLEGLHQPESNFQRALKELGVEMIYAYSPQAKGRVERVFRTLQDRLVKELRLRGIFSKAEANRFLSNYLPRFNKKYCFIAENPIDLHRKIPEDLDLRSVLCIKERRKLKNDHTIQYAGSLYQIKDRVVAKIISVESWLDSSLHFRCGKKELRYEKIVLPARTAIEEGPEKNHRINRVNPAPQDSAWRQFMINPPKALNK